jgi:hypothetical protein
MSLLWQSDSSVGVISTGDCRSLRTIEVHDFSGVETERGSSWGGLARYGSPEGSESSTAWGGEPPLD